MVRGGGGSYYDEDTNANENNIQKQIEQQKQQEQIQAQMNCFHKHLDPKIKVKDRISCNYRNPIVFALDTTSQMQDWSRTIYDKISVIFRQILQQGYLPDPAISVCVIGDYNLDDAPLQISEFQQGAQIDQSVKYIWNQKNYEHRKESYELAAYFYSQYCDLQNCESSFLFITGDEDDQKMIQKKAIKDVFNITIKERKLEIIDIWKILYQKFHVFHVRTFNFLDKKQKIFKNQKQDGKLQGLQNEQNILQMVENPLTCIDIMLGAIAIKSGTRDLNQYIQDMIARGKDEKAIQEIKQSLKHLTKMEKKNSQQQQQIQNQQVDQQVQQIQQNQQQQQIKNVQAQLEEIKINQNEQNVDNSAQKLIEKVRQKVMPIFQKDEIIQKKKIIFKEKMPQEFYCPITDEIFIDPVTADDGITYEKSAILIWFKISNISPSTGKQISNILTPNIGIQQLIESYQSLQQD